VTHSRCKLGLTATLVREDTLVEELFSLVGPKLYEANWLDLQEAGYLATVRCMEMWCAMPSEFYRAYLAESANKQRLLYAMNPNKFRTCEYLIRLHEARGDKILVFSDNIFALKTYALALGKPFIYADTSTHERLQFLSHFQSDAKINTLFISKVGDNSIDLPDVNVIIQISSHFSSRRQEAQRLGRILRPKSHVSGRFNAFFYTLVSRDTKEMYYATKRQRFLVDQGYAFQVVTEIAEMEEVKDLKFTNKRDQAELLTKILDANEKDVAEEHLDADPWDVLAAEKKKTVKKEKTTKKENARDSDKKDIISRRQGSTMTLSGADSIAYSEYDTRPAIKSKGKRGARNDLFHARETHKKKLRREERTGTLSLADSSSGGGGSGNDN
jgi:DNA excision repair protein ERCC-3